LIFTVIIGIFTRMKPITQLTPEQKQKCRDVVMETAREFDIPPIYITAHIRGKKADTARRQAMRRLIGEVGLLRCLVAKAFNRDLRRVRKSVLGV
jgi:hypothetical protein